MIPSPDPSPPRRRGRPRLAPTGLAAGAARVDRVGLHTRAVARLRAMIVQGELPPGAPIGEIELCEALGISRTPLREALKLLATEGLVELRHHRSALVAPISPEATAALFEALAGVERTAAELAATRATPAQLGCLAGLQEQIERHHAARELKHYFALNQRLHAEIVAASGNPVLAELHATLHARAERVRLNALTVSSSRWEESVREHREILAALEARDPTRAGAALSRHVLRTAEVARFALASLPETEPETN